MRYKNRGADVGCLESVIGIASILFAGSVAFDLSSPDSFIGVIGFLILWAILSIIIPLVVFGVLGILIKFFN